MLANPARDEILRRLPQAEFLISERAGEIDAEMIAAGRRLRLIQRLGSQTWDIDLEAARRADIPVCYWPNRSCALAAEHALLQMLALARRLPEQMHIAAQAGDWGRAPERSDEDHFAYNWSGRENVGGLRGRTVGILGFGEIGVELARRLRGMECAVLYLKRRRLPPEAESQLGVEYASREEIARRSDFLCSLLPFTAETEMSLDEGFFAGVKPGAALAHCGAGGVVDEAALMAALRSGRLSGAALDTYACEPLRPDDPLLELARDPARNVILTPHVAGGDTEAYRRELAENYTNVMSTLAGGRLQHRLA